MSENIETSEKMDSCNINLETELLKNERLIII